MRLQISFLKLRSVLHRTPDTQLCQVCGQQEPEGVHTDLKLVYQAINRDAAEKSLDDLEIKWGEGYPIVIKNWRDNWDRLTVYSSSHSISEG